ncbi:hypothetical protein GF312_07465, partial [Candidatus Poribacteria bacterium]|nr:hypothetical protein [Candidatus Poribacteria bacterium]
MNKISKIYNFPVVLITILLFSVLSNQVFAQEKPVKQEKSFYIHLGLGYSSITYSEDWKKTFESFDTHFGGIGFDLGVYIPLPNKNILMGFDANGA